MVRVTAIEVPLLSEEWEGKASLTMETGGEAALMLYQALRDTGGANYQRASFRLSLADFGSLAELVAEGWRLLSADADPRQTALRLVEGGRP